MNNNLFDLSNGFRKQLLFPILVLGVFLVFAGTAFTSTLYVDIAASFNVSIGTATTLSLISASLGLIMGLVISAISLRFKHKHIFVSGATISAVGILVLFFAQNFATAMLSYFLTGLGAPMITIMSVTLIGELFPLEKRGWRIGLTISGGFAAYLIVGPLSGYVEAIAGWRLFLLWFSFPLSLTCLALGLLIIPSNQLSKGTDSKSLYSQAYKQVFFNKSAIACLVCSTLVYFLSITTTWNVSFVRMTLSASPFMGGIFRAVSATAALAGGVIGGRLLNRVGRKPIAAVGIFVSSVSVMIFTFVPNVPNAFVVGVLMFAPLAFALAGLDSLILEQVPGFRSSMMSVNATFQNIGILVGIMIGTIVLTSYNKNFHLLYITLGLLGAIAVPIILLLTKDPTKNASRH